MCRIGFVERARRNFKAQSGKADKFLPAKTSRAGDGRGANVGIDPARRRLLRFALFRAGTARRARLMRHTISVLVENKFGVLTRIAGMFSGRGFNIDTLNVGPTLDSGTSRMTIVVRGDDSVLEQVTKQLRKLIDVIEVQDFREDEIGRAHV